MNSRQRNVLIRIISALAIFIYVGYLAWPLLPHFDFAVIVGFVVLYLVWQLISEIWIYQDPDDYVIEDDDQKSYLILQISFMLALLFATIDFVEWHITRHSDWEPTVIYAGLGVFVISCLVRWWGFRSIGRYFNARVAVYSQHRLITEGAYQKIRHPLYLGSLLSFLAIPMIFNSWGALLIIVFTTIPALIRRLNLEEEFLLQHFGDEYQDYMRRTKKMIPGIW